jgi:hypothetical protein
MHPVSDVLRSSRIPLKFNYIRTVEVGHTLVEEENLVCAAAYSMVPGHSFIENLTFD